MLYLDDKDLSPYVDAWDDTIAVIDSAVACLASGDFAQPVKPYLRYRNPKNRIIAMPAFVGGDSNAAGLKWIASFPGNLDRGLPRAHSVLVLNDADTGAPTCIINGALLSVLRTAGVSGYILKKWLARRAGPLRVGVTGFGPIGRHHVRMVSSLLGDRLEEVVVYDLRAPSREEVSACAGGRPARSVGSWQEAYDGADVFMTCTVSSERYIDRAPRPGSLHLNVSLRDYLPVTFPYFQGGIVVDDWDEVARENTDIEAFQKSHGLAREGTIPLAEVARSGLPSSDDRGRSDGVVMFNPMGMAVFDVALGTHFLAHAKAAGFGREL
ncbi:2,3-diaminopropionate biosynthesis protein SbnB [Sorangium sp. So ce1335]|uniref:2,3-diaminopropionate biosynthesis protein SbnB n=1 Tax=Sorangium sp. So ce1335 TaxID=3133335 RepID=UPI003F5F8158